MIRELPHEGLKTILHLLNAITRLGYWPRSLKRAKVIMILKPGKDPRDITYYRPINLLPVISKTLEKLLLSRLTKELPPPPDMDTIAPIWIPERALHNSSMPPTHRYHSQSLRRQEILLNSLSRCKTSFWQSLASGPTIINPTNPTPIILHPPEILLTTPLPKSLLQKCHLTPSPDPIGGSPGKYPGLISTHNIHGGQTANHRNHN
jgi:hypothetical protein